MTHRIGPKGQVVIPKAMRDELGLTPGDKVSFALDDGSIRIVPLRGDWRRLKGVFKGSRLTEALEEDHRWELEREERRGY